MYVYMCVKMYKNLNLYTYTRIKIYMCAMQF